MRLLPWIFLSAALAAPAAAQDGPRPAEPQAHEVRLDVDISVEKEANGALIDAQYTFTPGKLNRVDEVVAILRRFVRHPTSFFARITRRGYSREPATGGAVGGVLQLGPTYVGGDIGIEYDVVDYDPSEHAYWALPFTLEAGFRPMDSLSLGAFYNGRPVVGTVLDSHLTAQAERDGTDHKIGGRVAYSTPNDRLFVSLAGWGRIADWTFSGVRDGDVTIRGLGAAGRLTYQISGSLSLSFRLDIARDHWVDGRFNDEVNVGEDLDRNVIAFRGFGEVIYWHKGRYGFRFGLGGGYESAPPVINNRATPIVQIGLGVVTRF